MKQEEPWNDIFAIGDALSSNSMDKGLNTTLHRLLERNTLPREMTNLNSFAEQNSRSMLRRRRCQKVIGAWPFSPMMFFTRLPSRAQSQRRWSTIFLVILMSPHCPSLMKEYQRLI